ncbi:hypothetical protein FBY35_2752 [Streptomyces sp. SLBN-118]|uniref:hypothetical protein n=1 Tax=Streptomyces sp. SLBN-118 TaxID=2768454 RepID=UPI00114EFEB2|nr:hypothetical protein [Streptomyces sp. SLBN-118]TQK52321.1 hypothetical protein FBY35_2752 [Streptomyces sp. SLBN-118]
MFLVEFDRGSMRELSEGQVAKVGTTSEMNLRYGYFETDINFAVQGRDPEVFRGIPLVDFMFCLLLSAREIRQGESGRISFTENDRVLGFTPTAPGSIELVVTNSWDSQVGNCEVSEFLAAVSRFVDEGLEFIVERYSLFANNPTYRKLTGLRAELI